MANLTKELTWEHIEYSVSATTPILTIAREWMRAIKTKLIDSGSFTSEWTVVSSCDSTQSGAADYWDSDTDLVWATAGSAHSWIVLKQTGLATNFQICIDLSNTNSYICTIAYSYSSGFTGGSTTARPTASDEVVLLNNAQWCTSTTGSQIRKVHFFASSNGACWRICSFYDGTLNCVFEFEKIKNPVSWVTEPVICRVKFASTCFDNAVLLHASTNSSFLARIGGVSYNLQLVSIGLMNSCPLSSLTNFKQTTVNGDYTILPVWVVSNNNGVAGVIGKLYDFYLCPDNLVFGTYFDGASDDDKAWVVIGNYLMPSDGDTITV